MVTLGRYAEIGEPGDSLTTGNEGFLGAVVLYGKLAPYLASAFSGAAPLAPPGPGASAPPSGVTTFNRGAPTWHINGADGYSIQQVRQLQMPTLPPSITHLFFEAGTNDVTNQVDPATSNAQLVLAMSDALTQFPALQAFFYVGVACAGEMYQVVNGVPSFAGNTLLSGTVDAAIDSLMATLKASIQAQTGTNKLGQPVQYVYLDMRTAAALKLYASGLPPPWQNAGYLTPDGRHPLPPLQEVFRDTALSSITVMP